MLEQAAVTAGVVLVAAMVFVVEVGLIECALYVCPVVIAVVVDIAVVREVVNVVEQVDLQLNEVCLNLQLHPVYLDTELQVVCQHGDEALRVIEEAHTALRSVHSVFAEHDEVAQVVLQVRGCKIRVSMPLTLL